MSGVGSSTDTARIEEKTSQKLVSSEALSQNPISTEEGSAPTEPTNYLRGLRLHLITLAYVPLLKLPPIMLLNRNPKSLPLPFSHEHRDTHRQYIVSGNHESPAGIQSEQLDSHCLPTDLHR